jgi:DNA-binding response OmpR family regulator
MSETPLEATTILLLVSDAVVRTVFQEVLENEGYRVIPAGDLGSAVDRLREIRPAMLIIRSYVSDIPGHDAATYLRKRCPGLPVLMVGGQIEDDRLSSRNAIEKFYVFPKPFTAQQLLAEVRQILTRARANSL